VLPLRRQSPGADRLAGAYHFGFDPDGLTATEREQVDQYLQHVKDTQHEWETCGLPSCEVEHLDDRVTGYRTERLPLDQSGESQTLDTMAASRRLLGTMTDADPAACTSGPSRTPGITS
jgi:Rieske 2Fe-2S family protein